MNYFNTEKYQLCKTHTILFYIMYKKYHGSQRSSFEFTGLEQHEGEWMMTALGKLSLI